MATKIKNLKSKRAKYDEAKAYASNRCNQAILTIEKAEKLVKEAFEKAKVQAGKEFGDYLRPFEYWD